MKVTPNGLTATDEYATLHFTINGGTWIKFASCRFPIDWLLADSITDRMDSRVRRKLIAEWSEVDLGDPLF